MSQVEVCETFVSLQGESTWAGLPCFFVRLARCNLRCRYCDTTRAWEPGTVRSISELVREFHDSGVPMAEITGGEPLIQPDTPALAAELLAAGARPLLVETNGSCDISVLPPEVVTILDIKCPGSGETERMDWSNLRRLRPADEVKFVIAGRVDFDWAAEVVRREHLTLRGRAVLFSPATPACTAADLGGWILSARLDVRLQVQLHKRVGLP